MNLLVTDIDGFWKSAEVVCESTEESVGKKKEKKKRKRKRKKKEKKKQSAYPCDHGVHHEGVHALSFLLWI